MHQRLEIFRGGSGLAKVAPIWDALIGQIARPHFFHRRQWFESWLEALEGSPDRAIFCVIHENDAPAALLPLKEERRKIGGISLRTLELPRHDHLHLRDIVVRDASRQSLSLATIANLFKQSRDLKWDVLALWHLLDDSCAMALQKVEAAPWSTCAPRFTCSHMQLGQWDEFSKRLSKSFKQNLRTANNRAKAIEGLRFETVTQPGPAMEAALAAFIDVEASGWKSQTGTAIKQDDRLKNFYASLTRTFGQRNECEIHLLRQGDKPAAGLFLLFTDDTIYIPKVAYDEEFSRISPVQLLLERCFRELSQNRPGVKQLNLTSDAGWFDVWKPERSDVSNIYAFNTTVMGMAAWAAMGLARRWRERGKAA